MTDGRASASHRLEPTLWRETALWPIQGQQLRALAQIVAQDLKEAILAVEEAMAPGAAPTSTVRLRLRASALDLHHLRTFLLEIADEVVAGESSDDRRLRSEAGRCAREALRLAVRLERIVGSRRDPGEPTADVM